MPETAAPLLAIHRPADRAADVRRARLLAWAGLGWHAVEASVAIAAGIVASSVALVGFGADSVVEAIAGVVVLWRFAGARATSADAERRAQRLIGASFFAIALYVAIEATRSLIGGHAAEASWVGIGLSVATLLTMPPLAAAKARVAARLNSAATRSEGRQNLLCAYLSAALLAGLLANAALGWWWADPLAALVVAGVAVREGRAAWAGEPGCADGCCC
jgi:divalent metal cation (Fe/Co/Zn/Cd) transporter